MSPPEPARGAATKITEVAAAVIERPGEFLLAQRPEGKPYPGFWEFPGGKIEPGEDARAALARELAEELGIEVRAATPWITRVYAYTHATVRLHFFRVTRWEGEPRPLEDQAIRWQRLGHPDVSPMLPANAPVLAALALPAVMVVSDAARMGIDEWVRRLAELPLEEPVIVQLRDKELPRQKFQHLLSRTLAHLQPLGWPVVVNSANGRWPQCAHVHLTAGALMEQATRPEGVLAGASCHDEREIAKAVALGLDYVVLGAVKATPSHPRAEPLGWERFESLAAGLPMPVFAIGGMTRADLGEARARGAHGVALLGAAFSGA